MVLVYQVEDVLVDRLITEKITNLMCICATLAVLTKVIKYEYSSWSRYCYGRWPLPLRFFSADRDRIDLFLSLLVYLPDSLPLCPRFTIRKHYVKRLENHSPRRTVRFIFHSIVEMINWTGMCK